MNLTASQWLQIAAIAVSAVISIARWVWDARRAAKSIQAIQTVSDAKLATPRAKTRLGTRIAFFAPLIVLLWQTLSPGSITRFDFGIMVFSGVTFTGFMMLQIVNTVGMILEGSAAEANLTRKTVDGQVAQVALMTQIAEDLRSRTGKVGAPNEENEQAAAEPPAVSTSIS